MTQRETFGSRFGGLAIGLAVGLGNVWRFSYMVGQFGGAAFILLYLLIAALVGRSPPFIFPNDDYSSPRRDY